MMKVDIRHDTERQRFSALVDGRESYLDYGVVDDETLEYRRTYTPPDLRGRGIGRETVRTALEWASVEGKRVIPSCSFVQAHIDRETAR